MTIAADDLDLIDAEPHTDNSATSTTIPEKYTGKSVEDLIKMHQNAEKKISQQGADLAAQRRLSDTILELKRPESTTATKQAETRSPVTVDTLLADPEKALRSAVDSSDVARRAASAEDRVARLEASITQEKFVSKHTDFAKDLQNPEFLTWVQKNPVRASLGAAASKEDFQAANALWDMWDEHKELAVSKRPAGEGSRKGLSTIKPAPSSNGELEAPRFSRAKVMELRMKVQQGDAAAIARWSDAGFQARLHQAYAEDRVR